MQFSNVNLDKAVMRIFRRLRVGPDRGLRHAMLAKEWQRQSLRRRDLDGTLGRMVALCYMRQEKTPEGDMVYLTPVGREYAEELFESPLREFLLRLQTRWQLLWRRERHERDIDRPVRRRRIADRIAPTVS